MKKKLFLCCLSFLVSIVATQAAVLLETDFDGAIPDAGNSDLTNVTWAADAAITASSTVTSVSGHELSNIAPLGQTDSEWADNVGVDYNLNADRPTARGIAASFSVTGVNTGLSELTIGHTLTTNSGTLQAYASDMTVTLTNVTDGVDLFTDTTTYDYDTSPRAWQTHVYDVSTVVLESGKDYTITLTMQDLDGGGAYATWNLISLEGVSPSVPVLVAPTGNSVDPTTTTALEWSAPPAYVPEGYDLVFRANDANFIDTANNIIEITDATATSPQAVALDYSTTYYWQVTAYEPNTVGTSPVDIPHVGPVWTFTTIPAEPVIFPQPASGTGASVDLFVAASSAEVYEWYQVGTPDTLVQTTGTLGTPGDPNNTYPTGVEGYYYCVVSNTEGSDTSQTARVMTPRLVAHWKLDGDLTDSSVAGIWDGDLIDPNTANPNPDDGLLAYVEGVDGTTLGAAQFDGVFNVLIPDSNEFFTFHPQGFTLTAWLKGPFTSSQFNPKIVSKSYNWSITQISASEDMNGNLQGGGGGFGLLVPSAEINEGEWRLIAVTYDPDASEYAWYGIYDDTDVVDILHTTTRTGTANADNDTYHVYLGGGENGNNLIAGIVDDVRVYNYALTPTELQQIYSAVTSSALCMNIDDPTLEYDFNLDCQVTLEDFASFAAAWLNTQLQGP